MQRLNGLGADPCSRPSLPNEKRRSGHLRFHHKLVVPAMGLTAMAPYPTAARPDQARALLSGVGKTSTNHLDLDSDSDSDPAPGAIGRQRRRA